MPTKRLWPAGAYFGGGLHPRDTANSAYFGGAVISMAQIAAGRMYMEAR